MTIAKILAVAVAKRILTLDMSLDDFFMKPPKRVLWKKGSKSMPSTELTSHDGVTEQELMMKMSKSLAQSLK